MGLELITRAAAFAAEAHASQRRKTNGQPYVNHLLRVAASAARCGMGAEQVAAALLHDAVEDTPVTLDRLRGEFPERVVALVALLTQDWADDASEEIKRARKPGYFARILADPEAVALKLLDRADNLRDMANDLPREQRWAAKYLQRTREEMAALAAACPLGAAVREYREALAGLEAALASLGA